MSDLLNRFTNDDTVNLLRHALLLVSVLFVTVMARRLMPGILRRTVQYIERLSHVVKRRNQYFDEQMILTLAPPLRFFISLVGVWLATLIVTIPIEIRSHTQNAITSLFIVAVFWAIYREIGAVFGMLQAKAAEPDVVSPANETMLHFAARLIKTIVALVAFVIMLQRWGIDLNGLLAGLGLGGLAVALAAQEVLANLIGYFVIMTDAPFQVGDFVVAEKFQGTVEIIGFRTTRVRSPDRALVLVPNRIMSNEIMTNWSQSSAAGPRRGRTRLNITLGVTYSTSPDQMQTVVAALHDMLKEHDRVLKDSIIVNFVGFGASSLDILVVCLVRTRSWSDLQNIKQEINLRIMRILQECNVSLAFPTQTIVLDKDDA